MKIEKSLRNRGGLGGLAKIPREGVLEGVDQNSKIGFCVQSLSPAMFNHRVNYNYFNIQAEL